MLLLESASLSRIETILATLCNRCAVEYFRQHVTLRIFLHKRPQSLETTQGSPTYIISHFTIQSALRQTPPAVLTQTVVENGDSGATEDSTWLQRTIAGYRDSLEKFRSCEQLVWRERSRVLDRIHIAVEEYIAAGVATVTASDLVATQAFFQWYKMLVFLPVEEAPWSYDQEINFLIDRKNGVVEIYTDEHAGAAKFLELASTGERVTVAESNDNDAAAAAEALDEMEKNMLLLERQQVEFDIVDASKILRSTSRVERASIDVLDSQPKIPQAKQLNTNDAPSTTEVVAPTTTVKTLTPEQKRVLRLAKQVLDPPSAPTLDVLLTGEYEACDVRMLDDDHDEELLLAADACEALMAECTTTTAATTTTTGRITTTTITTTTVTRQRQQTRLLIDGVAGAGKTFLIGALLPRFANVQYLVKKRNFVTATKKRFDRYRCSERLNACTVDAFLMRTLNIRSLVEWLRMLREDFDRLCDMARDANVVPYVQNFNGGGDDAVRRGVLFFVDEFGLLENRLSCLLDIVLRDYRVLLVGDCNQQTAIGETSDQAIQTLFQYENVCFMYDNVRAKDPRMLQRLSQFSVRTEVVTRSAIEGLPDESSRIDLGEYLAEIAVAQTDTAVDRARRKLPRIIVNSNRTVNYINWAISCMIWRYARSVSHMVVDDDDDDDYNVDDDAEDLPEAIRAFVRGETIGNDKVVFARKTTLLRAIRYQRSVYYKDNARRKDATAVADIGDDKAVFSRQNTLLRSSRFDRGTYYRDNVRREDATVVTGGDSGDRKRCHESASEAMVKRSRREDASDSRPLRRVDDDPFADEHFVIVGLRYRMIHVLCQGALSVGTRVIVRAIESPTTVIVELDEGEPSARFRVHKCMVRSYEYKSSFDSETARFYMFPFVLDAATTVYQIQGITIASDEYENCYVDFYGMDDRAIYVTLSRFENQDQIRGIINKDFIH